MKKKITQQEKVKLLLDISGISVKKIAETSGINYNSLRCKLSHSSKNVLTDDDCVVITSAMVDLINKVNKLINK